MEYAIRPFRPSDAPTLSAVIRRTLYESNGKDYPAADLDYLAALYQPETLAALAAQGRMYVAAAGEEPVGCGALVPHSEHPDWGYLQAVFLRPDCQGRGLGRAILSALESDSLFHSYPRVEVHSSITARGFYESIGYRHATGVPVLEDGHYTMYK